MLPCRTEEEFGQPCWAMQLLDALLTMPVDNTLLTMLVVVSLRKTQAQLGQPWRKT